MSSERIQGVKRAFAVFDRNADGTISREEIRDVLLDAGVQFTETELASFMAQLDQNGDGSIDCNEFCKVMANVISTALDSEQRIKAAFEAIDRDGNGRLSQSELRKAVLDLGESITNQEAEDVIKLIDKDGDNEINYDEFVTLVYMLNIAS